MDEHEDDLELALQRQRVEVLIHGAWEEIRTLRDALADCERRRAGNPEIEDYVKENTRLWNELITISGLGDSKASQHAKMVINGA